MAPVARPTASIRRGPGEKLAAWVVTGPLGHFWSVAADITLLWVRYGLARLRRASSRR